jgi:hypothetical protein
MALEDYNTLYNNYRGIKKWNMKKMI